MKSTRNILGVVQNQGLVDRLSRIGIGVALIVIAVMSLNNSAEVVWETYAILLAVYPLLTGMLGWDPLYSLFEVKTCNLTGTNQCGTFPYEVDAALGNEPLPEKDYDHSLSSSHHT